ADCLAHEGAQRRLIGAVCSDCRLQALAPHFVCDAECASFAHGWMSRQGTLDLSRIDIVAAANDHLFAAAEQIEVAVLVDAADIASLEPALMAARGALRRIVKITRSSEVATDEDFTFAAGS